MITGANRGIGYQLTAELVARGHRVFATSRRIGETLACLAQKDPNVTIYEMDVSNEDSVFNTAQQLAQYPGLLDCVVSNAGILVQEDWESTIFSLDGRSLEAMLQVNVVGAARVIRCFDPLVRPGGIFATVTSEAGAISNAFSSLPGYAISKAAENKLVSIQNASGVNYRALAIHPGRVATDMNHESAEITPQKSAKGIADILTGSIKLPEEEWFVNYLGEPMPH